jgi:CcmD family protein
MTLPLTTALPANTGDGYVAAAYIVFFVILLVYVAIMALRLRHVQRELRDLQARTQESAGEETRRDAAGAPHAYGERTREREPV